MEKRPPRPMTPFDELVSSPQLQMIKLLLPYVPVSGPASARGTRQISGTAAARSGSSTALPHPNSDILRKMRQSRGLS